jgi:hypothetical protein
VTFIVVAQKSTALCFAAAFLCAASQYPFKSTYLFAIILIYISVMAWHHQLWLFMLPALIPVLDLAPWTGWFFIEEIDLLLLVTASFGYWNFDSDKPYTYVSWYGLSCIGVLSLAYIIGTYRGLNLIAAYEHYGLSDYSSQYNSLRIGKEWFWALIFLPLLMRAVGRNLGNIDTRFISGMLTGLAFVSAAVIIERLTFPGFFNFSSDYRTSAPFSAMHTGGAALDGFLALCTPLITVPLLTRKYSRNTIILLIFLAVSGYVGLTTFSRGLYFAYIASTIAIALLLIAPSFYKRKFNWRSLSVTGILFTIVICSLIQMFLSAGYRGFIAAIILLTSSWVISTTPITGRQLAASLFLAITIEVLILVLAQPPIMLPNKAITGILKPPYLMFILSALFFAFLIRHRGHATGLRARWINPPLIALICMSINMMWIGCHWAGQKSINSSIVIIALMLLAIGSNITTHHSIFRNNTNRIVYVFSFAVILTVAIPIASSYSASERFSHSSEDFQYRMRHWGQALDMMDRDYITNAFGMGLGTFPRTYFFRNELHESPAAINYIAEIGNRYVRLTGPIYSKGIGELLRLLQRVSLQQHRDYTLALDIRNSSNKAPNNFGVALCERQLLYRRNCIPVKLPAIASDLLWHHYEVNFNSQNLGATPWPWRTPIQVEFAIEGANASLDLDNISLRDDLGGELILNGTFSDVNNYWFFSSDHYHLPWHIKNFTFNIYFELGWIGLIALYSLLLHSIFRLFFSSRDGKITSIALLSAVIGFSVVGLTDSLLDVPRLGLLFFLIVISSVLQPVIVETASN